MLMNIEYTIILVLSLLFGMVVGFLDLSKRSRIKWLEQFIADQNKTIKDMQDRILAKSLEEYKVWQQPTTPDPPEIIDDFDDSAVGTISGEEKFK